MSYLKEFRLHWPNLLGAGLGLAFGLALNHFILNLFGPPLIREFGWTKAEFALVGSLGLITFFVMPLAGWITDHIGVRKAAIIGFSALPLAFLALSFQSGDIWQFYGLTLIQHSFGILTATMVFTRLVVERFDRARGLALSCLMSCPPVVGAIAAPIIAAVMAEHGWRTAYQVMALLSAGGGFVAVMLMGSTMGDAAKLANAEGPKMTRAEVLTMLRNPMFLLLFGGMFFCNVPQTLASGQMSVMLMENGADMAFAAALVSVYAISVVIGRFASGYALDRVSPQLVALVALGLPAIGYVAIAGDLDARWLLTGSIAIVGLAQGAETDVAAFLTARRFGIANYSFVFSLLMLGSSLASAGGSLVLSITVGATDSFDTFLIISAATTILGALSFALTGRVGQGRPTDDTAAMAARADLLRSAD